MQQARPVEADENRTAQIIVAFEDGERGGSERLGRRRGFGF